MMAPVSSFSFFLVEGHGFKRIGNNAYKRTLLMLETKLELKNKISFKSSKGLPTLAMRLWLLETWWHYN